MEDDRTGVLRPMTQEIQRVDHPWLDPNADLSTGEQLIVLVAAQTGKGDMEGLRETWGHLHKDNEDEMRAAYEAILQTHLFAGYARTYNALMTFSELGSEPPEESIEPSSENAEAWNQAGDDCCREVYGGVYEKLRENTGTWHPAMDTWMIECGYGRVLTREGLPLDLRELCVLAVLIGMDVPLQVRSHLYGCRNVGCSVDDVRLAVVLAHRVWNNDASRTCLMDFDEYMRRYDQA